MVNNAVTGDMSFKLDGDLISKYRNRSIEVSDRLSDDSDLIGNICPDLVYRVLQRKSLPTNRRRLLQQIFNEGVYSLNDLETLERSKFLPIWDKTDLDVVLLDDNAWTDKYSAPEFICSIFPKQKLFYTILLEMFKAKQIRCENHLLLQYNGLFSYLCVGIRRDEI